jgi:hypothetical protein
MRAPTVPMKWSPRWVRKLIAKLDDDWEPTDYGRTVSLILAQVNAARIEAWPE